jgi:hypothetical protein
MNERNFDDRILLDKYAKKLIKLMGEMNEDGIRLALDDVGFFETGEVRKGYSKSNQFENSKPTIFLKLNKN